MNQMTAFHEESAFAFSCCGDDLVGFLHGGDPGCAVGVLALVAGGPQYRGGVGRQMVTLGRRLSSEGIPVMRFDHRGLGDSEGTFRRFKAMEDDIATAITEFKRRVPNLRGVILWGGCDAATSALINAHKFPDVIGVIAGNPFVVTSAGSTKVVRQHYLSRIRQASFWKKLARREYNLVDYLTAALGKLRRVMSDSANKTSVKISRDDEDQSDFTVDLLTGLRNFEGKVLFLMGDRFLLSTAFDTLIDSSDEWRSAYGKSSYERRNIKGGDQVFSTSEAQTRLFDTASEWIHHTFPERFALNKSSSWHPEFKNADGKYTA